MKKPDPRWQRRKKDRPDEIIAAAVDVFAEKGFAAAKLEDIAKNAGVAKSSIFVYFDTKEDLFRAVVRTLLAPGIDAVRSSAESFDGPFSELAPMILLGIAHAMQVGQLPAIAKVVIGESRNFPDLARIWHDDLLAKAIATLSGVVKRAQLRGEINPGDPRLYVFSLVGPMLMATLFRTVFQGISKGPPDLQELAIQHARTMLPGMLAKPARRTK